jgi:glycosyltransferase involved in cell wall biosynthesis
MDTMRSERGGSSIRRSPDLPIIDGLDHPDLSIVVPFYNEQENIHEVHRRVSDALAALGKSYEIVFVNDGSRDRTAELANELAQQDPRLVVVHLSRNFGHQAAISAGIHVARGRGVVLMDGDLQDPPEVLGSFVQAWQDGHDVVYAIREKRKEGAFKRFGYFVFYRLLRAISDLDIPLDSGDFCLMDRRVVDVLKHLPEQMRFVRGLRTFVGFRQIGVRYERAARKAGKPKYSLRDLLGLAVDGLVSFSSYPLHLVTYLGVSAIVLALLLSLWVLYDALSRHSAPQGWASTTVVVLFMSAIQLISLGIMGEYVRRIFIESKRRPAYVVSGLLRHGSQELPGWPYVQPETAPQVEKDGAHTDIR